MLLFSPCAVIAPKWSSVVSEEGGFLTAALLLVLIYMTALSGLGIAARTREPAGRLLDELDYAWFEDPIRTTDMDGLIQLASELDLPLHVGEVLLGVGTV